MEETLQQNLASVRERIRLACARARRSVETVRLVAVTKYVDQAVCAALLGLGVADLGESRVQSLATRAARLGARLESAWEPSLERHSAPRWHMIGHLQRNKVKAVLKATRTVHSLDSIRLADALAAEAENAGAILDVFLEVNLSREETKSGATPEDARGIAEHVNNLSGLRLRGLMTMAPLGQPESARPVFAGLRSLLEGWRRAGVVAAGCQDLSMGMSQDFEAAIEEGATWVRVGSALFEDIQK